MRRTDVGCVRGRTDVGIRVGGEGRGGMKERWVGVWMCTDAGQKVMSLVYGGKGKSIFE